MDTFFAIRQLFQITEMNGFSPAQLKRSPLPLPRLLNDYYQQLGKVEPLNHTQDQLLPPEEIYLCEQEKYLIFYEENQCCCVWGIQVTDLPQNNPPVYISDDQRSWTKDADTISEFLWTMANFQAALGGLPFCDEDFVEVNQQGYQFIKEKYNLRPQNRLYFAKIEFFANYEDEVIMITQNDDEHYQCFYAAATEKHFQQLEKFFSF